MKKTAMSVVFGVCVLISPLPSKSEPITLSVLFVGAVKAAIAYLGGKAAIGYGVTKIVTTKAGTLILKKQTVTLASGATTLAVVAVSASALSASLAEAGVNVELNEDSINEIADRAIDIFSNGGGKMTQKLCISPGGQTFPVPEWMACGEGTEKNAVLDLNDFISIAD